MTDATSSKLQPPRAPDPFSRPALHRSEQVGVYAGRILKGGCWHARGSTKFELVINAETARMLGLNVPDKLLARADQVIE